LPLANSQGLFCLHTMAIFEIHIQNHIDTDLINQKLDSLMATIQELTAKVDELQTKLDAEQQQVADALATLQQAVTDLQTQLTDGGTTEQRQALLDKLNSAITDLEGTVADTPPQG